MGLSATVADSSPVRLSVRAVRAQEPGDAFLINYPGAPDVTFSAGRNGVPERPN
jgi:hypothetical protein